MIVAGEVSKQLIFAGKVSRNYYLLERYLKLIIAGKVSKK